jgi:cell fate regulator YaaT (PSP1 superfamily)
MADVVGVRFRRAGKVYHFDLAGIELDTGDFVVVDTARGQELGQVVTKPAQVSDSETNRNLKSVVRKATDEDMEKANGFRLKEKEALDECERLVAKMELPMKLISTEYSFDGNRLTVYFGAEGRVDFRELVRELSHKLKVRVEMRQVGPRDEAKIIGGFGRCGRPLCCTGFLSEFSPVSIKMAKEQDLPLNPMKISGVCGRLLCCLGFECEQYREMKARMPREGERLSTDMGVVSVVGGNPLKGVVLVELESGARVEMPITDIAIDKKEPRGKKRKG